MTPPLAVHTSLNSVLTYSGFSFSSFLYQNLAKTSRITEKEDIDQHLECAAPKRR